MDTVTHSLLGAALAKTRLGRVSPLAPAALVLAANFPDLENVVLMFCDKPTNMIHHRSVTHAVTGLAVLAPLFALVIHRLSKRFARAGPQASFWTLFAGIGLAMASHPLLDWLNTYGVRPWLPFDGTWYHGDLVHIIDPWLWLLLGGAVCLAGARTRAGSVALAVLGLLMTGFVLVFRGAALSALQVIWPIAIAALALARWRGFGRRHAHAVAMVGFGLAAGYLGFRGWAGRAAWRMSQPIIAAELPPGETIIAHTLNPQPANPLRWQIIAETEQAVYRHEFSITGAAGGAVRLLKRLDDPLVARVADSPAGRAWRIFARHPVAAVARYGNMRRVFLMDARYPIFPARGFSSFTIDVPWTTDMRAVRGQPPQGT